MAGSVLTVAIVSVGRIIFYVVYERS